MMKPLVVLTLLSFASVSGAADAPRAGVKPMKKRAKPVVQAPAARPGARAEMKRPAPAPTPTPAPVVCGWTSLDPVTGACGGPGCATPPCSTVNRGAQGMGGGALWTCTCR